MAFQQVGLEAVLKGVGTYTANAGRVVTSNKAISKSLNVAAAAAGKFRKILSLAMKATAIAAVVGIAASIKVFTDFDAAMTQSIAIMGDLSDAMRQDMERTAREVALATTFSMKEAAESYFFLASAGLDAAASIKSLPVVARFAQAGMFDMALATDLLTDAQSALGLTIRDDAVANMENMARVSDVLVKANTLANATVQQFSESLTREAGAALKTFNIDIEEGVAVLAAFADQGVKGEVAGSGLSRILRLMTAAAVNSSDAYERLSIEVFNADGNINNLADIIGDLEVALGDMNDEQRVAALQTLGFSARIQGVILPLLGTSQAIRDYEEGLRAAGGITEEVAEKQLTSLSAQFSLLRSGIEDLLFTIGKALEPALRALVRTIREDLIPWVGVKLPLAIDKVKETFEEWEPVLKESARFLNDVREAIVSFGQWILDNQAALVVAIVAIGAALIWATPVGGIAVGIGAITLAIGILKTDFQDLEGVALSLRIEFLELGKSLREFVLFATTIGGGIIPEFNLLRLAGVDLEGQISAIVSELDVLRSKQRTLAGDMGFVIDQVDSYRSALEDVIVSLDLGVDRTTAISQALLTYGDRLSKTDQAAFRAARTNADLADVLFNTQRSARLAGEGVAEFSLRLLQSAEATAVLTEQLNALVRASGFGAALVGLRQFGERIAVLKAELGLGPSPTFAPPPVPGLPGGGGIADAINDVADEGLTAWERAIAAWLGAIAIGVREGTITVVDALDELEDSMVGRATAIVDALVAEQLRIATEFQIMADIIENGAATLEDAARLFDIGALGAAEQVLRTLAGQNTELADQIRRARIAALFPIFPTASFQEGGFVPEGQTVSATLHGPEIIVPLGANTQALNTLGAALSGFSLPAGGGFRNFGSINLLAGSDRDTVAMRAITRALGV